MVRKMFLGMLVAVLTVSFSSSFASAAKGGQSATHRKDAGKRQDGTKSQKGKDAAAAKGGNAGTHSNKDGSKHPHGADDTAN
jgi:hypothetical protein